MAQSPVLSRQPSAAQSPQLSRQPSAAKPPSTNKDHAIPYYNVKPRGADGYESEESEDTATEDDYGAFPQVPANNVPPMWQHARQESGSAVKRFAANGTQIVSQPRTRSPEDDSHSRASTLRGDFHDFDYPTSLSRRAKMEKLVEEEFAPVQAPGASRVPGPLESQLASLMSKLIFMEQKNPAVSVTPQEYQEMRARLKTLEEEKKTWTKRHEAIWALRDEDVENNIKIRGMLAKARRDLEAMTKLRDEDLVNVQVVRIKLADANRQLDRLQSPSGRSSPNRASRSSVFLERRDTTDLFAVAKAAALQERALELERRNSDLLAQIEALKGSSSANIDELNRVTAHQAWKSTVTDLETKMRAKDAEIARLRAAGGAGVGAAPAAAPSGAVEWHRVEALHEEHAGYRERMGARLQALRGEKEALQRELHRKEDECHALEAKVQSLQRRVM